MEARIIDSYTQAKRQVPDRPHLAKSRLLRHELYTLEPRFKCTTCKEAIDSINDGWYTSTKGGIYCEECAGVNADAFYYADGEMRKDAGEIYTYEPPPKPETFRKIRVYLAVQTNRTVPTVRPVEGPSYKFDGVRVNPDVLNLKGKEICENRVQIVKPTRSRYEELMARIGPDRHPPLEVVDRRLAYLQARGYDRDPAYEPES